jgi:hypothetical protein
MKNNVNMAEMQRYVARVAITPSTLRKLGPKGTTNGSVRKAINFLMALDLRPVATLPISEYSDRFRPRNPSYNLKRVKMISTRSFGKRTQRTGEFHVASLTCHFGRRTRVWHRV